MKLLEQVHYNTLPATIQQLVPALLILLRSCAAFRRPHCIQVTLLRTCLYFVLEHARNIRHFQLTDLLLYWPRRISCDFLLALSRNSLCRLSDLYFFLHDDLHWPIHKHLHWFFDDNLDYLLNDDLFWSFSIS